MGDTQGWNRPSGMHRTRQDRPGHAIHSWLDGDEQTVAVFRKPANEGDAKASLSCNSCYDPEAIPLVNRWCMRHRPWAQTG